MSLPKNIKFKTFHHTCPICRSRNIDRQEEYKQLSEDNTMYREKTYCLDCKATTIWKDYFDPREDTSEHPDNFEEE